MAKVREKVHEELMSKLFKKNHPYASLERSEEDAEADEFLPVVQISSRHQPDLDLSEYYRNWKSVAEPDVIMPEPNPLSPNAMFADVKPMSPVAPFRATVSRAPSLSTASFEEPPPQPPRRSDSITRLDEINTYNDEVMAEFGKSPSPPPLPSPLALSPIPSFDEAKSETSQSERYSPVKSIHARLEDNEFNLTHFDKEERVGDDENMDEIDRQLAILMNNLSAPLSEKQRLCEKCMALLDEEMGIWRNGRFFHRNCFTCSACHKVLGESDEFKFSATTDTVYCSACFEQNQESCHACDEPIVGKVIHINNWSFHPDCFCCQRCQVNLQSVDCTVNNEQLVCTTCFHRINSPHCERCNEQIMPDEGELESKQIKIGNAYFCKKCFSCQDCSVMLWSEESGGAFMIDSVYCCKKCHRQRRKAAFLNKKRVC